MSSVLKPAQMPSAYHSISESACELIPILYSLSPTFIDAANLGTIELGLVVIIELFATCHTHIENVVWRYDTI